MSRRLRNRAFQPPTEKHNLLIQDGILFARQDLSSQDQSHVRKKKTNPKPNHHNTGKKTHFHRLAIKQNIFHFCLKFLAQPRDNFLKQNGRAQRRMAICKWTVHKHWKRMNILHAGQRRDFFLRSLQQGILLAFCACLFLSFLWKDIFSYPLRFIVFCQLLHWNKFSL